MASIQRLTSPLTGRITYRVQIRLKGHPSQSATFSHRKDADRWAGSIEAAIFEGRHFPHTRSQRIDFETLAARYRETILADATPARKANTGRHLSWWAERFAGLPLAAITPDRIAEARDALASQPVVRRTAAGGASDDGAVIPIRRRSGATVNRYLATLSHLFATAVLEWRLLEKNPVRDVVKKKEARGRSRFLTDDERDALLTACARSGWSALHALVQLAILTGARRGELIRLRWSDVALEGPRPYVLVQRTKNGDPRQLPLVGRTLDCLRRLKARAGTRSEYLFPSATDPGKPYQAFDAHWYAALRRARIVDFRFHDLRHTCASYLASQGASLLEIADVLGHRTLAMVKRYSHLAQGHKATVIARMAKLRGL